MANSRPVVALHRAASDEEKRQDSTHQVWSSCVNGAPEAVLPVVHLSPCHPEGHFGLCDARPGSPQD